MKKRLLITFGDSFTYGLQEEDDKCLEYSVGSHLSEWLGFDRYVNFSKPAWGNETVWKEFLNKNPRETFHDWDVYCIFIASYFVRLTLPLDNYYFTLSYNSKELPIMKEWILMNDNPIKVLEKVNCDVIKEILQTFNDWNWKWLLGFNDINDENVFKNKFNKIRSEKIIPPSFSRGMYHGAPKKYHCKVTDHLNKDGYHHVAKLIFDYILETNPNWKGNGTPTKEEDNIDYFKDSEIDLTNRTPF